MFIRNAWYVVAWDFEVLADTILERTVLGESIVAYRKADGTPVVMENRCCHRGAPLALGRKEGDCLRCMYHGMKFDASGQCVEVPGQTLIPPKAKVRTYPVVERTRWIWVWMGDPVLADPTTIPNTFSIQHPKWRTKPGYKHFVAIMRSATPPRAGTHPPPPGSASFPRCVPCGWNRRTARPASPGCPRAGSRRTPG